MLQKNIRIHGFTIVELVVVIVVIGILAGIVTVAYNAIIKDSRQETAKTDARGVAAAVMKYRSESGKYPWDLNGITLPSSESAIQYDGNPITNTFCVTASLKGEAWYIESGNSLPKQGTCVGHGVDGQSMIVNYYKNPNMALTGAITTTGTASGQFMTNGGMFGPSYARITVPSGSGGISLGGHSVDYILVKPNKKYTISMYVRHNYGSDVYVNYRLTVTFPNQSGTAMAIIQNRNVRGGAWTRISHTVTTPTNWNGTSAPRMQIGLSDSSVDVDGVMVTEGETLYPFRDGSSAGCAWSGAPDDSYSICTP